jgi:hypothetical protein
MINKNEDNAINKMSPLILLSNKITLEHPHLIKVSRRLVNPDELVLQTKQHYQKFKKRIYNKNNQIIAINVTSDNLNRALRFMNGLIKLLKARGHKIVCNDYATQVCLFEVEIEIALREATKRIPSKEPYRTADYVRTEKFILKTNRWSRQKEWKDGKFLIETKLALIVAKLELDAQYEIELNKRIELQRIERQKTEKLKREIEQSKIQENQKISQLVLDAENYQKANLIREFIQTKETWARETLNFNDGFVNWLNWAKNKANEIDPLIAIYRV